MCVYLALLYGLAYVFLRSEGLPSVGVQLFTLLFYAIAIAGLCCHRRREPLVSAKIPVEKREFRLVTMLFAVLLALALACSMFAANPIIHVAVALNLIIWTPLGLVLTLLALGNGFWERLGQTKRSFRDTSRKTTGK